MVLTATEWATQIATTLVPRMSQKANPAVNALGRTAPQLRIELEHRVERRLILPDQRLGAIVPVPIRAKREKLLDPDGKKARLSLECETSFAHPRPTASKPKLREAGRGFLLRSAPNARHRSPHTVIVNLIGNTKTRKGLKIKKSSMTHNITRASKSSPG
jgi:hypothetical protein